MLANNWLDMHRRAVLDANILFIQEHPFDHGYTEEAVLNL